MNAARKTATRARRSLGAVAGWVEAEGAGAGRGVCGEGVVVEVDVAAGYAARVGAVAGADDLDVSRLKFC